MMSDDGNVAMRLDSKQITSDLKQSIINVCKTGLQYKTQLRIEGIVGVTVDSDQIFLVNINELVGVSKLGSVHGATSPPKRCSQAAPTENNSVMDLCVKSTVVTPPRSHPETSEASSRACPEQDTHNPYSISSLDSSVTTTNCSQKSSSASASDDGVRVEVTRSDSINSCGSRKRSRKSKTTRHISKQLVYSASDEDGATGFEDSRSSLEAATPEIATAEADDEPVNLSASSRCAPQVTSDDVKTNNNLESRGSELFGANSMQALAAMSMLNNLPALHGDASLPGLNPLMALSEQHQQQQAQWLNSLAAHLLPGMQAAQAPLNQHLPLIAPADVTLNKNNVAFDSSANPSSAPALNNMATRPPGPLKVSNTNRKVPSSVIARCTATFFAGRQPSRPAPLLALPSAARHGSSREPGSSSGSVACADAVDRQQVATCPQRSRDESGEGGSGEE